MTDIDLIKSKLDIVDVVSSYVSELKKAGTNYRALCPFHSEKSPSFMVNPSIQIYKCFGCGKGGDVINFIQEIENMDFQDALKVSAEKAHIELSTTYSSPQTKREQKEKDSIIDANTATAKFYNYILNTHPIGKSGREYAQKRGIDGDRIKDFTIGYAPNSKDNLKKFLLQKGFNEKDLINWGLLIERESYGKLSVIDKFRHRLMHPICNVKGDVIGFSGRYIGTSKEAPKYLNSPETPVYKKNENLYGFFQAKEFIRKAKFVIIEEGNVDILSSHRVGVGNIVAPLGTAFTENQAKLLKRFSDEFYFCFDTDNAGVNALIKSISIAENLEIKHRVVDVNPYKDPDELIMSEPNLWSERIKNSINSFEYLINLFSKESDLSSADGKQSFSSNILPILSLIKDEISLSHFIKKVSIMLEINEGILISKLKSKNNIDKIPFKYVEKDLNITKVATKPTVRDINKENEIKIEKYFLSLLVLSNTLKQSKIHSEVFFEQKLKNIYEKLSKNSDDDPASIYDDLSVEEKLCFEEIMMFDSSYIKDLKKEVDKMEIIVKERYLKKEIMKLRREMMGDENEEKLKKLQTLTAEIKKVRK